MSMASQRPIVIAITTFRRPELLDRLLDAVLNQACQHPAWQDISVLVVDNDPLGTARNVATARSGVKYVIETVPGIAAARQRALDEVPGNALLACLDDDVLPSGDWLGPLVGAWESYSATIVAGYVEYVYPDAIEAWVVEGGFMRRSVRPTGTALVAAEAGNMLVDVERVSRLGVRFDPTLGLSGGEDTLFSMQVVRAGGTIVACHESLVLGHVPVERTTRTFCRNRARSHGSAAVLVGLRLSRSPFGRSSVRFRGAVGGAMRMVWGLVHGLRGHLTAAPGTAGNGVRIAARGCGMMSAALGSLSNEYRR